MNTFAEGMAKEGLGDQWARILSALSEVISVYERGNRIVSLGRDIAYRKEGIRDAIRPKDSVLDAGCGPGVMSELSLKLVDGLSSVVLLDPLRPMLHAAQARLEGLRPPAICGLFEHLPFRDECFDAVMCGFAIRDAVDMKRAIEELARVTRRDGRLLVVELGKPDGIASRLLVGFYWRFVAGTLTTLLLGRRGLPFYALRITYERLPVNHRFKGLLQERFREVTFKTKMMGGVVIAVAKR